MRMDLAGDRFQVAEGYQVEFPPGEHVIVVGGVVASPSRSTRWLRQQGSRRWRARARPPDSRPEPASPTAPTAPPPAEPASRAARIRASSVEMPPPMLVAPVSTAGAAAAAGSLSAAAGAAVTRSSNTTSLLVPVIVMMPRPGRDAGPSKSSVPLVTVVPALYESRPVSTSVPVPLRVNGIGVPVIAPPLMVALP